MTVSNDLINDPNLSAGAKMLYCVFKGRKSKHMFIKNAELTEVLKCSVRHLTKFRRELTQYNYLEYHQDSKRKFSANVYTLLK